MNPGVITDFFNLTYYLDCRKNEAGKKRESTKIRAVMS